MLLQSKQEDKLLYTDQCTYATFITTSSQQYRIWYRDDNPHISYRTHRKALRA